MHFNQSEKQRKYYMLSSFNPCFNGSCTSTKSFRNPNYNGKWVSILVLMDHALQRKNKGGKKE